MSLLISSALVLFTVTPTGSIVLTYIAIFSSADEQSHNFYPFSNIYLFTSNQRDHINCTDNREGKSFNCDHLMHHIARYIQQ